MASQKARLLPILLRYADQYGIDRGVAESQIQQESGFRIGVCSGKAACGPAQFIPGTAARFGIRDRNDPEQAFRGYGQYMNLLLRMFGGDYCKALAGYNAGEGRVKQYKGIPPYPETQNYVKVIMRNAGRTCGGGAVPGAVSRPVITSRSVPSRGAGSTLSAYVVASVVGVSLLAGLALFSSHGK